MFGIVAEGLGWGGVCVDITIACLGTRGGISYWRGRVGPCRERWSSHRQRKQEATLGAGKGPLLWTIGTVLVKKTALCVALQAGGHCWRVSCLLQRGHPGGEGAGEA